MVLYTKLREESIPWFFTHTIGSLRKWYFTSYNAIEIELVFYHLGMSILPFYIFMYS
jgi:hypothetical protein